MEFPLAKGVPKRASLEPCQRISFDAAKNRVQNTSTCSTFCPCRCNGQSLRRRKSGKMAQTCVEDCEIYEISDHDIMQLCLQDPAFGLFLTKLIVARLSDNLMQSETSNPSATPGSWRAGHQQTPASFNE